jgi:hypothetical protein
MKKWTIITVVLTLLAFVLLIGGCTKKYSLTISSNGQGMTNPTIGTYTFADGQTVTVTATPANGWDLNSWSGDASGSNLSITVLMDGDKKIVADFSESLKQRATKWNALSTQEKGLREDEALRQIEGYLQPSAARSQRAKEFYQSWVTNSANATFKEVASSTDDAIIDPDGVHGTVRYTSVYEYIGPQYLDLKPGDRQTVNHITKWILIDKVWYRTMEVEQATP